MAHGFVLLVINAMYTYTHLPPVKFVDVALDVDITPKYGGFQTPRHTSKSVTEK